MKYLKSAGDPALNWLFDPRQQAALGALVNRAPRRQRGELSVKYETSGRGAGTVSNGRGDPGGASYGAYQLSSKMGSTKDFFAHEGAGWAPRFAGMREGTPQYAAAWKALAAEQPEAFAQAQHDYIDRTHFQPQMKHIEEATGLDLSKRSNALQDVIWSTAVQHGGGADIFPRALRNVADPNDDEAVIRAVYAERGRMGPGGKLAYFQKSPLDWQPGLADRFVREQADALRMLQAERGGR